MDRTIPVGEFVCLLKREIAERQAIVDRLDAFLDPEVAPATERRRGGSGAGAYAVEVLREAGRPMHGLDEIWPQLVALGVAPKSRAGFATLLLRTGKIVRTAPGTFGLASDAVSP